MNNLFPYPIKKKINFSRIIIITSLIIGAVCIIYIDHQVKKIPLAKDQSIQKIEEHLNHKFNPKESAIEIEKTDNGFRIKTPQEIIREVAKKDNFNNPEYLIRLSDCESSLGSRMLNAEGNKPRGSRDRGWFQINSYWHPEVTDEQAWDIRFATNFAINLIKAGKKNEFICAKYIK